MASKGITFRPNRWRGPRRDERKRYTFKDLIELNNKTSNQIVIELITTIDKFVPHLNLNVKPVWIVLITEILSKVGSSFLKVNKTDILTAVAKSFSEMIVNYIRSLTFDVPDVWRDQQGSNRFFSEDVENFFVNLGIVCESLFDVVPTEACEILPNLLELVDNSSRGLEEKYNVKVSRETKLKNKRLMEKLDAYKRGISPLYNFRKLNIYPTIEELLSLNPDFEVEGVVHDKYDNVEQYLEVQFQLLKEQLVAPLREDVTKYVEQLKGTNNDDDTTLSFIEIHPNVVFRSIGTYKEKVGTILYFSDPEASDMIFSTYRLNRGTIVCFSKDNFSSVSFGYVIEKHWEKRYLLIGYDSECSNYEWNVPYTMVNCKCYIERYDHCMNAIQNVMSEVNFPLRNYLIDGDTRVIRPDYLDASSAYSILGKEVHLYGNNWPTADELKMDSSQFIAFKAALTQKFVSIQGHPGTGKTYVGVKIIETLLHNENKKLWYNSAPILIICMSNFGLDQIMEELISITEGNIVRAGGQCNNRNLDGFSLENRSETVASNYGDALNTLKHKTKLLLNKIKTCSNILKRIKNYSQVIAFKQFAEIDANFTNSWFSCASDSELLDWLFEEPTIPNLQLNSNELDEIDETEVVKYPGVVRLLSNEEDKAILLSMSSMERDIVDLESNSTRQTNDNLEKLQQIFDYFKMRMHNGKTLPAPTERPNVDYRSPHSMQPDNRWNLYFYWLNLYQKLMAKKLVELQIEHQSVNKKFVELRNIIDAGIMKRKLVVGMTVTGAARLRIALQALECRIVIVEEAAEVMESHLVISLTNHCQHFISLGGHQRLRSSTGDHHLKNKNSFGASLSERMIRNKMQCNVLDVQHRMRPEIAQLMVPHIYSNLQNHHSVTSIKSISGIDSCLYFIHHEHPEVLEENGNKTNLHEVKFLINLARYLRQNGYKAEDIMIVGAYSSQGDALYTESTMIDYLLKNVQIYPLDSNQRKECKIVLLSLVINNQIDEKYLFKMEKLIGVAMSRAKEGIYMMGNMNMLCNNTQLWPKIKEVLVRQNAFGNSLPLRCEVHRDHVTQITEPEDFQNVPNGGCNKICEDLLKCGHPCLQLCHSLDRDHTKIACSNADCSMA